MTGRYSWSFLRPLAQTTDTITLVEEDGLCLSLYEVDGGWQCQGNGIVTVIRKLMSLGYRPSSVTEVDHE